MTTFHFATLTPQQALAILPSDVVIFDDGPARDASVTFNTAASAADPATITVSLHGHSVDFGLAVIGGRQLIFTGQSTLFIGGAGPDTIEDSGPHDDAVFGGDGDDVLTDGGFPDVVQGNLLIQGNAGNDTIIADRGNDVLYGGKGDDLMFTGRGQAGEGADFAQGNRGNDTLHGGGGNDTLLGGQGDDSITGGAGDDFISGDLGLNVLSGGAGADTFHVSDFMPGQGNVSARILDFSLAEGDRILADGSGMIFVEQVGADTVVTLPFEGTVVLVGVDASTLGAQWIFSLG